MGLLARILGRGRAPRGPRLRPESVRAVLLLLEADAPEPAGDGVELVMRACVERNRELFKALMERDLWPQVKIATGRLAAGERDDPAQLAERVARTCGEGTSGLVQLVRRPLQEGAPERELVLLTVHGASAEERAAADYRPLEGAILPLLDLTEPVAERAK